MGEPLTSLLGVAVILGCFALIMGFVWLFSKWGLGGIGAVISLAIIAVGAYIKTENLFLSISFMILAAICCVYIQMNQAESKEEKKARKEQKAKAA